MRNSASPEPPGAERRREPRILPDPPVEVVARHAAGSTLHGRLVDASPHGLAFACEDRLAAGEVLDLEIRRMDDSVFLGPVPVRVLAVREEGLDCLAHCAFDEAPASDWLAELEAL